MFKKSSLLSAAIICLVSTNADAKKVFGKSEKKITKATTLEQKIANAKKLAFETSILKSSGTRSLAKTTVTQSRLIATAARSYSGSSSKLIDSAKLYFGSPNRGGDMESDNILFDSVLTYTLGTSTLIRDYYGKQNFDALDNIKSNLNKFWDVSSYINGSQSFFTNTASKKVATDSTQTWDGSMWENNSKRKVSYNAANQILIDSNFTWDGISAWENSYVTINTYNAAGKITKSTIRIWFTPTWLTASTSDYTYDASGYLTQLIMKSLNSTFSLENSARVTYTNDASGNPIVEKMDDWNTAGAGSWENSSQTLNQYNASKKLIVAIAQNWESATSKFDTVNQYRYTYNTYGQVKTEMYDTLNVASKAWVKNDSTIYYYEDYTPTAIKELSQSFDMKVYPVPTNNELSIQISTEKSQNIQLSLLDIQGRKVLETERTFSNQAAQKIQVNYLPTGTYVLQLRGADGFSEVRQITIAH